MILVNRLYSVLSVILIILVTVFYLVYMTKYENKEYILYMQSNSSYALQITSPSTSSKVFRPLLPYDITTSSYNPQYYPGRVYLGAYDGHTKTGRFVLVFLNSPSAITFDVMTKERVSVKTNNVITLPPPYYPLYIDFHIAGDTEYIDLEYSTVNTSNQLYKLSIEFY